MPDARTVEANPVTATVVAPADGRYFEWGPVILGTLGASAISIVLLTFGAALGLAGVSPYPYAGLSAKALGILSATFAAIVVVISFALGGYLAGRTRSAWAGGSTVESHFRDGAHGFGVWALSVVLGSVLAVSGAAGVFKTALQSTTAVVAAGAAGAGANPATGAAAARLSTGASDYAVDRILAPSDSAAPAGGTARGELAPAIARALAANLENPQLDVTDRTMLVRVVVRQTGMPQAEAEKRVDEAFANFKAAERKARDAAEAARKGALIAGFAAAAILAVACAASCLGASLGGRHRDEGTLVSFFGSPRFW